MRNVAFLTWLVVMLSGCGVLMMSSPKSDNPADPPRCSESRGGVVLDGLFASTYGLAAVLSLAEGAEEVALVTALLGTVHVASGVAGYRSAARCTKAHEAHQAWLDTDAPRPGHLLDEDGAEMMGVAGSACYPNRTCNPGLSCDPDSELCVAPSAEDSTPATDTPAITASAPDTTAPPPAATAPLAATPPPAVTAPPVATPTPGETAANAPATTTSAQPGTQSRNQPTARPTPPRRQPRAPRRAPASDEPWGDFWREVNP